MQDIRRAIAQASRRLFVTSALQRMVIVFTILTSLLIPAIIIDRLQGGVIDWNAVLPMVALAGLIATLLWAIIKRPSQMAAARELDDRAGLHESLSTALCVAGDDDPWSRAVVASSIERARSVDVRKAIPIAAPRRWGSPFVSLLLFGILFWTLPVAGARERAPANSVACSGDRVDVVWQCPMCGRNSLRSFYAGALRKKSPAA